MLHSGYDYFKPIQTWIEYGTDSLSVKPYCKGIIHKEAYCYNMPLSPHLAAHFANSEIDIDKIDIPDVENLLIEGAGGVLVPINDKFLMVDLIKKIGAPAIIVSRAGLGTINHTLLTIEALRYRDCSMAGVILNNVVDTKQCDDNARAIEHYGNVPVLAQLPKLNCDNNLLEQMLSETLPPVLSQLFS